MSPIVSTRSQSFQNNSNNAYLAIKNAIKNLKGTPCSTVSFGNRHNAYTQRAAIYRLLTHALKVHYCKQKNHESDIVDINNNIAATYNDT
jgi:hypothetical protein